MIEPIQVISSHSKSYHLHNSHIITAKNLNIIKIKVYIITQTTTDCLDDYNEKTIIIGVYDTKEKAEWLIECEIEQHPYAKNKTSNSYRTIRFDEFNGRKYVIESTVVEFEI